MGDSQYRSTDPSRLYFRNVRRSAYYQVPREGVRMDIYRHRKLEDRRDVPLLRPLIVDNWRSDEAYIFLEKNDYPLFPDTLRIRWAIGDSIGGEYVMGLPSRQQQYELAGRLYDSVLKGHALFLQNARGEWVPFLQEPRNRSVFTTTMQDYYTLTER